MSEFRVHDNPLRSPLKISTESIILKQKTGSIPPSSGNIIYNNNGMLVYKSKDGTITVLANN